MLGTQKHNGAGQHLPSAKRLVKTVLSELDLQADFNLIKRRWPEADGINNSFAEYLTGHIPDLDNTKPSLLHKCLWGAIQHWHEKRNEQGMRPFYNYMRGLTWYLPEALEWCVYTENRGGSSIWDPLSEGLSCWWQQQQKQPQFVRRERPHDPTNTGMSPDTYRLIALVKIVTGKNFNMLQKELNYIIGRDQNFST